MLSFIKSKLEVKLSFFVCVIIVIALQLTEQFFIIFLVVSIHELSHVSAAKAFGLNTEKIIMTPIGQIAVINDMKRVGTIREILILSAGPAVNFLMACAAFLILNRPSFFITANLLIGIFNLLPVYPLDGGRILYSLLENSAGVLRSNKIIISLNKIFSKIMIFLGIAQVVIYPFNMSLLLIGVYIKKITEEEKINLTLNYYRELIRKLDD